MWTLVYSGTEKALADWGICADVTSSAINKQKRTVRFRTTERLDRGGPQFAFLQPVTIWRDRTAVGSGGTIWFQGYFDDPRQVAQGGREFVQYAAHNVWWLFELQTFKQQRSQFTGWDATHFSLHAVQASTPGTGYVSGDVLTAAGGTLGTGGRAATVLVTTVNGTGGVTGVRMADVGKYTVAPTLANLMTGGHGSGAVINLVFGDCPILTNIVLPEIYLGESTAETFMTNGQQVQEVINWVNECFNATKRGATVGRNDAYDVVQVGTIDPQAFFPISRVNTMFCSEVIREVLRWSYDAVIDIDETTTPPTLNVRTLSKWNYATLPPTFVDYTNLPEVTVTITSDQERSMALQSKHVNQVPGVLIHYKTFALIDGVYTQAIVVDRAPTGGGAPTDWTPLALSALIDVPGAVLTHTRAVVKTTPITDLTTGDQVAWLRAHDKTLASQRVPGSSISVVGAITITDDSGSAIDTTAYPNELDPKTPVPSWAGASCIRATVRAKVKYAHYSDDGLTVKDAQASEHEITHQIILTTASTQTYETVDHFDSGGAIPQGCADAVYRSINAQQYEGSIEFVGQQARSDIKIGCRLKLIGPTTTFSNLMVQGFRVAPHFGRVEVDFGPAGPMDVNMWQSLAMASRYRKIYQMPSGRSAGTPAGGGGAIDTGNTAPQNNTSHGQGGKSGVWVTFNY